MLDKNYQYAIRKTTLGVGSIAIGLLVSGKVESVQAQEALKPELPALKETSVFEEEVVSESSASLDQPVLEEDVKEETTALMMSSEKPAIPVKAESQSTIPGVESSNFNVSINSKNQGDFVKEMSFTMTFTKDVSDVVDISFRNKYDGKKLSVLGVRSVDLISSDGIHYGQMESYNGGVRLRFNANKNKAESMRFGMFFERYDVAGDSYSNFYGKDGPMDMPINIQMLVNGRVASEVSNHLSLKGAKPENKRTVTDSLSWNDYYEFNGKGSSIPESPYKGVHLFEIHSRDTLIVEDGSTLSNHYFSLKINDLRDALSSNQNVLEYTVQYDEGTKIYNVNDKYVPRVDTEFGYISYFKSINVYDRQYLGDGFYEVVEKNESVDGYYGTIGVVSRIDSSSPIVGNNVAKRPQDACIGRRGLVNSINDPFLEVLSYTKGEYANSPKIVYRWHIDKIVNNLVTKLGYDWNDAVEIDSSNGMNFDMKLTEKTIKNAVKADDAGNYYGIHYSNGVEYYVHDMEGTMVNGRKDKFDPELAQFKRISSNDTG